MSEETENNKYQLQLNIVIGLITILVLGTSIYTKKLIDETEIQNQSYIQERTMRVSKNISNEIDEYFKELDYIKRRIIENPIIVDETKSELLQSRESIGIFNTIIIIDDKGNGITANGQNVELGEKAYFKEIKESDYKYISEPQNDRALGENIMIYSVPIHQNDEKVGYILGVNRHKNIENQLKMGLYGNDSKAYIVNEQGQVIFSTYTSHVGRNIRGILNIDYDAPIKFDESNVSKAEINGEKSYIGYSIIEDNKDWYAINIVPEYEVLSNIEGTTRILTILIGAIIIAFMVICRYFVKVQKRLKKSAYKDKISKINNYEKFIQDGTNYIKSKRKSKRVVLVCFDVDKFKIINDIHGYETGNSVIKTIGKNLKNSLQSGAVYGRITGDIFALLIEIGENDDEILDIVHFIKNDIVDLKRHKEINYGINIQVCVGVYIVQDEDYDMKKILSNADMARKRAKENIYQPYVIFDENMKLEIEEMARIEKDLFYSIENKELEVYYQPKYNINSGKIVGSEALIRWNHPTMGMISPMKFIPIAEKNRFINQIGKWVFEEVCINLRECINEGIDVVPIAVNISRVELYQPALIEIFRDCLELYNIDPRLIEIEITETTALNNIKFINSKLNEIKRLGIKVAMDDFGTGNSNLSNLKDIAIDTLKLDRSLLMDIEKDKKTEVMVKSIVSLSDNLSLNIICEGVENNNQINVIRTTGCEIVQGFVFSKPIKKYEYKRMLSANEAKSV